MSDQDTPQNDQGSEPSPPPAVPETPYVEPADTIQGDDQSPSRNVITDSEGSEKVSG